MKKIGKFWKLFNKDNNQHTDTVEKQESTTVESEPSETTSKEEKNTGQSENNSDSKESKMNDGKARIYNLIIVDESGSMSHLREATLSGINETISTIRSAQEEFLTTQEHTLTLVTFDSGSNRPDVRTMIDNQPISGVKDFKDYIPSLSFNISSSLKNGIKS